VALWSFLEGADERFPSLIETKSCFLVHVVRMEFNLSGLHDDVIQVMALRGEYGGVAKLDTVIQLDAVFCYGWLVRMF
jgi:hypothetical protein